MDCAETPFQLSCKGRQYNPRSSIQIHNFGLSALIGIGRLSRDDNDKTCVGRPQRFIQQRKAFLSKNSEACYTIRTRASDLQRSTKHHSIRAGGCGKKEVQLSIRRKIRLVRQVETSAACVGRKKRCHNSCCCINSP